MVFSFSRGRAADHGRYALISQPTKTASGIHFFRCLRKERPLSLDVAPMAQSLISPAKLYLIIAVPFGYWTIIFLPNRITIQ